MAPRAYWKGYLKLALVSCPVKLYAATTAANKISFNQLHKDTLNRVQMKYHDPELGEIERSDLVKGYQFEKDRYVIVDKEELDAIQIESNKTIDIEGFVDASEIDDLYLDSPYYLGPDGPVAEETYAVIKEALARTDKVGIARVVLSGRERLIALKPYDDGMVMTTLRSAKEVRDAAHYFEDLEVEMNDELLQMAEMIINQKVMEFDSSTFVDRYEEALLELVKAKIDGKEPVISKAPEQGKVVNLMDALKASIQEDRAPAAASKPKKAAKKATAKKTPAKKSKSA
ncbi:MAG: Ku protein [Paracoccaceae bacterium]